VEGCNILGRCDGQHVVHNCIHQQPRLKQTGQGRRWRRARPAAAVELRIKVAVKVTTHQEGAFRSRDRSQISEERLPRLTGGRPIEAHNSGRFTLELALDRDEM
jgi:hypothetical protein